MPARSVTSSPAKPYASRQRASTPALGVRAAEGRIRRGRPVGCRPSAQFPPGPGPTPPPHPIGRGLRDCRADRLGVRQHRWPGGAFGDVAGAGLREVWAALRRPGAAAPHPPVRRRRPRTAACSIASTSQAADHEGPDDRETDVGMRGGVHLCGPCEALCNRVRRHRGTRPQCGNAKRRSACRTSSRARTSARTRLRSKVEGPEHCERQRPVR